PHLLHLRDDGVAEGGGPGPRQPARQRAGDPVGLAVERQRPPGARPAPVPRARAVRGAPRDTAGRRLGGAPGPLRAGRRAVGGATPRGHPVLRRADDVPPPWPIPPRGRAWPPPALRVGIGSARPRAGSERATSGASGRTATSGSRDGPRR